jgi:hypothetical protein
MTDIRIPILRLELQEIKTSILSALDARHGELKEAIEKGIDLAYQQIPIVLAERIREGIIEAVTEGTYHALREFYGPGGHGYEKIMDNLKSKLTEYEV